MKVCQIDFQIPGFNEIYISQTFVVERKSGHAIICLFLLEEGCWELYSGARTCRTCYNQGALPFPVIWDNQMQTPWLYIFYSRAGTSHVSGIPSLCRLFQGSLGWEDAKPWESEILALKQHIFWYAIHFLFYFQHICLTKALPADTFTTCSGAYFMLLPDFSITTHPSYLHHHSAGNTGCWDFRFGC